MVQEAQQIQATQPVTESAVKPAQQVPVEGGVKWYKKWWIWLIVAIVIIGAGAGYWFF